MGFDSSILLLIYLCSQELLKYWVLWEEKKIKWIKVMFFLQEMGVYFFISVLLSGDLSTQVLEWKGIAKL